MNVGFLGAGRIATALAGHFTRAGHRVMLSGRRGPAALSGVIDELGPLASAGTPAEAAKFGDVVVLAVLWDAVPDVLASAGLLDGKVLVDVSNPLQEVDGALRVADLGGRTSSEVVASLAPGARVVKAFNRHFADVLAQDPATGGAGKRLITIAGDDRAAKDAVAGLAKDAGFAVADFGDLIEGGAMFQVGSQIGGTDIREL